MILRLHPLRCALMGLALVSLLARADSPRTDVSLASGWRFAFGETPGAESTAFNDSAWSEVSVPHTWNAKDGQDGVLAGPTNINTMMKGDYARGSGWYRRVIKGSADWAGRQVYLQVDGANRKTDVFVNGVFVGSHLGGNARFRFNLTSFLKQDADNLLAIRVNNMTNQSIPLSADFTFFGGLYRSVSLVVTDSVQVETMDYGSPGVFLKQASVTPEKADVDARVELANHTASPVKAEVRVRVLDASGSVVQEAKGSADLAAQGGGEVTVPVSVSKPHLWNGRADPYLYHAVVDVLVGGVLRDSVTQPLGLRFYKVDPQQGFILNGNHIDLHGVSRHQDRQDKGWALSEDDDREDFGLIKEIGATAIRVAHYQQSPLWYQLADENGLVLWSEVPFVDEAIPSASFFNNALDQMRELIRQNYNHPAIFFWGCGNENGDEGKNFVERIAHYGPLSEQLIQSLNALAHAEDPTRLTTYASFHSETEVNFALPGQKPMHFMGEPQRWYTDVTDFNKYYGWYYGEPSDAATFWDTLHAKYPTQPIGVSEYGAGAALSQHEDVAYGTAAVPRIPMERPRPIAFAKFHPEEYQAYYHEQTWNVFRTRPYIWSKFVWNMFDFASDGRNEGDHPGRNDKGLVSFDRKTRKDAFYFYKANWGSEPVLHLNGSRFTHRTSPVTQVKAYSTGTEVELTVNGHSLGKKPVSDLKIVQWDGVALQPGVNHVEISGVVGGKTLTDSCDWTYTAAAK